MRQGEAKHLVTPRTLLFLHHDDRWLFVEGGPSKWFAGRLNGLGGSVEPGEDVLAAAHREAVEETGMDPFELRFVATVHVAAEPAVMLFVFLGELPGREVNESAEGRLAWHGIADLADPEIPFLSDVRALLPRLAPRGVNEPVVHIATRPK